MVRHRVPFGQVIESFTFQDEYDCEYKIFSVLKVVLAREPGSFWRENVIAVVIVLRVLTRISRWRKQVIKC